MNILTSQPNLVGTEALRSLDRRTELEQARLLARQLPVLIMTGLLLPLLMAFALFREVPPMVLIGWMTPLVAVGLLRLRWHLDLRRNLLSEEAMPRFMRRMQVTAIITGGVWGALAIVLYMSSSLQSQLLLLVVITGIAAGAVNSLGSHLYMYFSFTIPMFLPHTIALLVMRQAQESVIAIMTMTFMLSMAFVARNANQAIRSAIRLRFENEALAEERDKERRLAEEANADKSRFLAAASHDLRQPLHALSLFFGSLEERNRQPELQPILARVKQSLDSLHGLFSSLMDLSKLDAGAQRPSMRDFALGSLLGQLEAEHFITARAKGLSLRVFSPEVWVRSDPVMLKRMLDNLIANAIRYTDTGGVLVGCRRRGSVVTIEVWDSGVGIPSDRYRDIFREFVQLSNSERNRDKGLGLGLAIVRRLSLLLDHPVGVISRVGRGSKFWLTVPASVRPQTTAPVLMDRPVRGDYAPMRILVIDDDERVREATASLLEDWGHRVLSAPDEGGARGVLGDGFVPDVVIADYRLADGQNGVAVVRRLLADMRGQPRTIFISGDPLAQDATEFGRGGAILLNKPLSPEALRNALGAPVPAAAMHS